MKKNVKIIASIAGVLLACAAVAFSMLRPLAVETIAIQPQTVSLTFTEPGSYEYSRLYSVYPLVSGEILEMAVAEGDRVRAGDVIAVVSASDYEYQIRQLENTIAGYNGQIANLQLQEQQEQASLSSTLQSLQGQLMSLEAEMAKNRSATTSLDIQIGIQERIVMYNANNVGQARKYLQEMRDYGDDYEITEARQAFTNAQNALAQNQLLLEQLLEGDVPEDIYEGQRKALEGQIEAINQQLAQSYVGGMSAYYGAQIEAARASIQQMEEKTGQATITAPIDGVVSQLPARDQNVLSPQTLVACIGDAPYVEVFVPVREIDGVHLGDGVELLLDKRTGSETIPAIVIDMEEEAQVKISALGVEERKIRVLLKPEEPVLQIGYDMDVRFSPYTYHGVLVAPKTAVFPYHSGDAVWVARNGRLEVQPVTKGVETRDGYIIEGGLAAGNVVVVDADNADLRAGKAVSA